MAQATDGDTMDVDKVHLFPGAGSEPPPRSKRRRKDRTGAARQAKFRSRNKSDRYERRDKDAPSSPDVDAPPIAPTVTQAARNGVTTSRETRPLVGEASTQAKSNRLIRMCTLVAALGLATVSGGFSITGMTSIFVGAYWPVVSMGVALELGKLSAVAWLGHQRSTAPWRLRAALTTLVAVLMTLNAVGCFGYLSKAHISHQVEGETAIGGRMAELQGRISVQEGIVLVSIARLRR